MSGSTVSPTKEQWSRWYDACRSHHTAEHDFRKLFAELCAQINQANPLADPERAELQKLRTQFADEVKKGIAAAEQTAKEWQQTAENVVCSDPRYGELQQRHRQLIVDHAALQKKCNEMHRRAQVAEGQVLRVERYKRNLEKTRNELMKCGRALDSVSKRYAQLQSRSLWTAMKEWFGQ